MVKPILARFQRFLWDQKEFLTLLKWHIMFVVLLFFFTVSIFLDPTRQFLIKQFLLKKDRVRDLRAYVLSVIYVYIANQIKLRQ